MGWLYVADAKMQIIEKKLQSRVLDLTALGVRPDKRARWRKNAKYLRNYALHVWAVGAKLLQGRKGRVALHSSMLRGWITPAEFFADSHSFFVGAEIHSLHDWEVSYG